MLVFARYAESILAHNPVILLGSGTSAGVGISGMGALASWLIKTVDTSHFTAAETAEWEQISRRLNSEKMGLEQALQASGNKLTAAITEQMVKQTWLRIAQDEREALIRLAAGEDLLGFCRFFNRFSDSTEAVLHIITTNYDHLLEWSASACGWQVWDGFDHGLIAAPMDPNEVNKRMSRVVSSGKKLAVRPIRHVRVYKPHGSLSWFKRPDGSLIRISNISPHDLPSLTARGFFPAIVTPGTTKYLETHLDPYHLIMAEMNGVIQEAHAFIFMGFGFNDDHILGRFYAKLKHPRIPKLIMARTLTPSFHGLREHGQIANYVAVEKSGRNSRVYSDVIGNIEELHGELWTLTGMLSAAWGAVDEDGPVVNI